MPVENVGGFCSSSLTEDTFLCLSRIACAVRSENIWSTEIGNNAKQPRTKIYFKIIQQNEHNNIINDKKQFIRSVLNLKGKKTETNVKIYDYLKWQNIHF